MGAEARVNIPRVRIVLDLGDSNRWVAVAPVEQSYPHRSSGVLRAAGLAMAMFSETVIRDAERVAERLVELEDR